MKRETLKTALFLVVITMMWGCYPQYGANDVDDYDLVYTNYVENYNFKGKPNYALPDKIVEITGDAQGLPVYMNQVYADLILNRIRLNMTGLGYTEVTDTALADFVILPGVLEITTITYDYWGYYWGWYYPYYPYYPYAVVTDYTTGTLLMNLVDRKTLTPNNKSTIAWVGIVNGLLEGDTDFGNRINKTVDQAFAQSDYLHQ